MGVLEAFVLGVVQGLTEFLPISSSGHLELVPRVFGWERGGGVASRAFDVALHFGTLCAVVAYFRMDLSRYVAAGIRQVMPGRQRSSDGRLGWLLILSAVPASVIGVVAGSFIDDRLGTPTAIGWSLILFGVVLAIADRAVGARSIESTGIRDATLIGCAQILALNPGTSRSGVTISAGRAIGLSRDAAVRFSFLMGVPVIFGAFLYEMARLVRDGVPDGFVVPMVVGALTAGLVGWLAIAGIMTFVRTKSFTPFVVYRIVLGVVVLLAS